MKLFSCYTAVTNSNFFDGNTSEMPLVVYLYFSISKPFEIYTQGQDYKGRPSSISDFTTFEVMPLNLAKKK